jgi:hypothetical protein
MANTENATIITNALQNNKLYFRDKCINQYISILDKIEYGISLRLYLSDSTRNYTNSEIISEIIEENIQDNNNLTYQKKISNWTRFVDNEIYFLVKSKKYILGFYNQEKDYMEVGIKEAQKCCEYFWNKDFNKDLYGRYNEFILFKDIILENTVNQDKQKSNIEYDLDAEIWDRFLIRVLSDSFTEFTYSVKYSNTQKHRLIKEINNHWLLGIEFQKGFIKKSFKNGEVYFPDYFNLILIRKEDERDNFKNKGISLGILANPFSFFSPIPPDRFMLWLRTSNENDTISLNKIANVEIIKDKRISIKYDQYFATQSKEYIIFYISILKYTSTPYFDFLEKVILELPTDDIEIEK